MKKTIFGMLLTCIVVTNHNCSTPAHVESVPNLSLSFYKTYMWVNTMAKQDDASKRATDFADLPVRNAVNQELQLLGWKESNNNPEVLISYDILVDKRESIENNPIYSEPYTRWYYNRFRKKWSNIYYPSELLGFQEYQVNDKEATITITMMAADSDKKIWQGWTTERLGDSRLTDLGIKKSVRNIFKESEKTAAN